MVRKGLIFFSLILSSLAVWPQSNRYWPRSFNEESSLLSGAVVGGGVGPSAIYYNPAAIADVQNSSLSFHANLFSFEVYRINNALGEGTMLANDRLLIQPRFISYLVHPKQNKKLSIELAYLNNEHFRNEFNGSIEEQTMISPAIDGPERYFSNYHYYNEFRDDWVGIGGSFQLNNHWFVGASIFIPVKTVEYRQKLTIDLYPENTPYDSVYNPVNSSVSFDESYSAVNFRLLAKLAFLWKGKSWTLGACIRSPSVNVFSSGKRIANRQSQTNIIDGETLTIVPDFIVVDSKQKNQVDANFKDPLSFALGFTRKFPDRNSTLYGTAEYFFGLDVYKYISAEINTSISDQPLIPEDQLSNWLTFYSAARPVFNFAIGYQKILKENLKLMAGFRTDFNSRKASGLDSESHKSFYNLPINVYHLSGGLTVRLFGQDVITGFQYSMGWEKGFQQIANLSQPEMYNAGNNKALQGSPEKNMSVFYNAFSVYFGATLNFLN